MAGRLATLRVVDPVLTNIALGYKNGEMIGDKLFPSVSVARSGVKVPTFGKESFTIEKTKRALRARRARIDVSTGELEVSLDEHSLEGAVDSNEVEESWFELAKSEQQVVQDKLALGREDQQATLATTAGNYAAANKTTLAGNNQWNVDHADSTPVTDIETGADAIRKKIGRYPNTLVLGPDVWKALRHHATITALLGNSDLKVVTEEHVKAIFTWLKNVHVGTAVKKSGATLADVWGKFALLAYVPESPGRGVPAYGYTFVKKGRPRTVKYREESANSDIIAVEEQYGVYQTMVDGGYLISAAVS